LLFYDLVQHKKDVNFAFWVGLGLGSAFTFTVLLFVGLYLN